MRAHVLLFGSVLLFGCGEGGTSPWVESDLEELLADGADD